MTWEAPHPGIYVSPMEVESYMYQKMYISKHFLHKSQQLKTTQTSINKILDK